MLELTIYKLCYKKFRLFYFLLNQNLYKFKVFIKNISCFIIDYSRQKLSLLLISFKLIVNNNCIVFKN